MNRRLYGVLSGIVAVGVIASLGAPGSSANAVSNSPRVGNVPDVQVPTLPGELTSAELEDIQFVADERGLSLEDAIAEIGWHQSFAALANEVRAAYPDDYAGARIEPSGDPWIAFRGEVPREVIDRVNQFDREVLSRDQYQRAGGSAYGVRLISGRGYSEAELDEKVVVAHFGALDLKDAVANASSGYDIATGAVTVTVSLTEAERAKPEKDVIADLRAGAPELAGVDLRILSDLGVSEHVNIYGGDKMNDGTYVCTSGFTVQRYGTRGIASAAHCPNLAWYMHGVLLHFEGEHQGTWGDVQWHSSSSSYEYDDFYSGSSVDYDVNLRDVSSVGNAVEGQQLCRNGISTYKECDTVYQLNHCAGSVCHLTAMNNNEAAAGDSGGPWFWGNAAYGFHQGQKWWNLKYRDVFTPQQYLHYGVSDVYVATT